MSLDQSSKLIDVLPNIDIVITMGCNVNCPNILSKHREDWGLDDPTGLCEEEFIKTVRKTEEKVKELSYRILEKKINLWLNLIGKPLSYMLHFWIKNVTYFHIDLARYLLYNEYY